MRLTAADASSARATDRLTNTLSSFVLDDGGSLWCSKVVCNDSSRRSRRLGGRGPDRGDRPPRRRRRGDARRARGRGARRRGRRAGGRCRARRLAPLLGEAVPGAAARARARRPDDRGDRDRVRVAPRLARAARRRPQPARQGAGRARTSSSAVPNRPRSGTTARASTPGCSRSAARRAGRAAATASGRTRSSTRCLHEVAAAADVDPEEIPTAIDGCGVLTFALPLERMALMFARLEQVDGGARVAAAMRAHPDLIRGPMAADSLLMRELDGWTAKGGAEGLLCACGPGGLGIALKVEDGSMRAMRPALAELLAPARVRDGRARRRAARELARRGRRRDRLGPVPTAG